MPPPEGYRVGRLRRRRRSVTERRQTLLLVLLAGIVAFAAVLGAWALASRLLGKEEKAKPAGYLALVTLSGPPSGRPVAAALAIKDPGDGYSLYVIPRELLLEGPRGEYVFAGDAMIAGTLKQDLERLIDAKVDAIYDVPASAVVELAAAGELPVRLSRPIALEVGGTKRSYKDKALVPSGDVPTLLAASGPNGEDATVLQESLWRALLEAAALRPDDARSRAVGALVERSTGSTDKWYLSDVLRGLSTGAATVARVPSTSRVAEGQFAFVPEPAGIMAAITRKASGYRSRFTVVVKNGTGELGIGDAVARRLSVLDVNLPAPVNAESFDYRQTQILAGREAVPVAQDIHAILGRGVVLNGADLPPASVVVIVGGDLKAKNVKPKDQP